MVRKNTLERGIFDSAYRIFSDPSANGTRKIAYKIAKHYQRYSNEGQKDTIKQYGRGK